MSCQIKTVASLIDVDSIKRHLFPFPPDNEMEVFDPWEWPDTNSQRSNGKEQCWLQECLVSLSSTGELLVIAHKNVMIILTSKWDSQEEGEVKTKYHITWHGNPCEYENEQITSVLCLPLISKGKSSHCGPDWTCIIAGFSSGFVRFYTENSSLLLSELLHNESVTHLKCQSFEPARFLTAQEHSEEVYVMYPSAVCVLTGFGLFQTLRACRNQLARVQANCGGMLKAPPLMYKKWGFTEQDRVVDSEVVGPATNNTFDHLVTASLCGGFSTSYRSSAPQTSLVLAAGKKPYVGFHYALEGEAPPIFAEVKKAVVNRVKSAFGQVVPGWMRGRGNNPVEKVNEISATEPPVSMVCRFGLCDILRHGDRVVISPNRNLTIVSDSLGRVILIDNLKGLAIRMWKGYRDAQCGWLEVREEGRQHSINSKNVPHPRVALFLVIYVPKQGIIEIWAMQQGPRVAKFTASRSGRLLYIGHGLVGLNNIPLKGGNRPQFYCVFIDPSGLVKEISVPFHLALSDKNSKRARDLHLLKKLKAFLKEGDYDDEKLVEEVRKTVQELKTNDVRTQAIEMLSTSKYIIPDALSIAANIVVDKLIEQAPDSLDHSCKALLQMAQRLQRLVSFYQFVHQEHEIPPTYNTVVADDLNSLQTLSSHMQASEREVLSLRKLVETVDSVALKTNSQLEARVTFQEDGKTVFVEFLSCFEVGGPLQESSTISLKKNVPEDKLKRSGEIMYQGTLYSNTEAEDWKEAAAKSHIDPANLMQLALQFWLQKREGEALEAEMLRFAELLKAICSLADVSVICAEYNELSSWWRDIRNVLMDSTNPLMALTAAIVCRAVALYVEKEKEAKNNSHDVPMPNTVPADEVSQQQELSSVSPDDETHSSANEWENVSRDTCQWSMLIGQLEDVALLDTVLRHNPAPAEKGGVTKSSKHRLFCCPYSRPAVSLNYILNKGRGCVSELVARWLSFAGLDPCRLVDLSDVEFDNVEQQHTEENAFRKAASLDIKEGCKLEVEQGAEATPANDHESAILANLSTLKRHFPYSLTSSILLANLCWEFMLTWHRNVDELDALCAAMECLQTVPSPHLKEGLCSMVWTMHIKQRFESAAQLFQKVGKTPKERLCRQEIGISDLEMPLFLETCTTFLDIFLEASLMTAAQVPLDASRYEELWNCGDLGPPSLAELALTQPTVNYDLLHLHYQLALALHMMASFSLRFPRPITSLFDSVGQAALFADLTSQPQLPSHNPDPSCVSVRTHFLCKVITGAIQMIHKVESDENDQDDQVKRLDARLAVQWMSKCYSLASVWQVSSDVLRRHQICELYSSGYDRLAEEVMPAVQNPSLLASQLLLIMGQRLRKIVMNSADMGAKMSHLCPALSTWLDSLDEDNLKSSDAPELINLPQLLAVIMLHLPENHQEYNLAVYMVDTVQALISTNQNKCGT